MEEVGWRCGKGEGRGGKGVRRVRGRVKIGQWVGRKDN